MSAQTAAYHCPTELTFVSANEVENTVAFSAPSKHQVGRVNTVQFYLQTGETFCDCKGAERGRECWHQTLVAAVRAPGVHSTQSRHRFFPVDNSFGTPSFSGFLLP